jgi:hypothetical protein
MKNLINNFKKLKVWVQVFIILMLYPFIVISIPFVIIYFIYEYFYFKGEKFQAIKNNIKEYVDDCNNLNDHIEELKTNFKEIKSKDYGSASLTDNSSYNYQRKELNKYKDNKYVYNCSLQICRNAQEQPFVYLTKYFNLKNDEEPLNIFEEMLNNFESAEQGKTLLENKRQEVLQKIDNEIPYLIKTFRTSKLEKELGFSKIVFNNLHFPTYTFSYISSGGNASMRTDITLDIDNLNKFVEYLSDNIKWRKSVQGQRALMTSKLREYIKERDNYTCKHCNNSINNEPNLLLEIDHKIPLSKGGMTTEDNLQTLCWRCNRTKGSKIIE